MLCVNRRTGFYDLKRLLKYVAILYNGSVELMVARSTSMTCIEEWILFFEFTYGRTTIHWIDHTKNQNVNKKVLRSLLKRKIEQELQTYRNLLMYTTVDEDIKLRKTETWNQWFPDTKRLQVYIHYNIDVPLTKSGNPGLQKALFSEYYVGCCAKGGVILQ